MKTFAFANALFIFAVLSLFTVDCLSRSLDLSENRLSTRSPARSNPLCMLNRSGHQRRRRSSAQSSEKDEDHGCSKSIDSVEEHDWSSNSASGHFRNSMLSSKSTDSSSHWYSKYNKAKTHAYNSKKKHYQSHSKFHQPATHASEKYAPGTIDSTGSVVDNPANRVDETGIAVNNPTNELNNPWGVPNNPWDLVKDPFHDSSGNNYQGKATFFYQGGNPGACGKVHDDSDFVVAIQSEMYGGGKFCGKTVVITRKSTGKSIKCIAADECPGCPTHQSLDLSVGAFNALGSPGEGVFDIDWSVID